jgi:hypothetical protein
MSETPDLQRIETTLWEIVTAVQEVASSNDEVLAVLEAMLEEGRISTLSRALSWAA